MRYAVPAIGLVVLVAVVLAADPPKLGPEWTYDKEMKQYTKDMVIKVTRSGGGNVQGYGLDLRHDKVRAYDTDDNIASGVTINGSMSLELEIRKDKKGEPQYIFFFVKKSSYHDLNGDGVWDAWYDSRGVGRIRNIWLDERWVPVEDSKAGFGHGPEQSPDRKTEYTWDGKAWTSRPANR
ncbi:MAG TPA: hypothetical protein VM597_38120 [Gemmataceae bacterium]|jgi:hypothetical protein|nr:hypothetical protein [Gemmataceae bacterium]